MKTVYRQRNTRLITRLPSPLELCFYLFLRSCSAKPLLCKVCSPRCNRPPPALHLSSVRAAAAATLVPVYLLIHPSIHPFFSLSLPLICYPIIISQCLKARQSLLSQSDAPHFSITNTISRPCCILSFPGPC